MLIQYYSGNLAGAGTVFLSQVLGASLRGAELVIWCRREVREGMRFSAGLWGGERRWACSRHPAWEVEYAAGGWK